MRPANFAVARQPWPKCVELFELDPLSRVEDQPKFGEGDKARIFATRIVVELEEVEARQYDVKPGTFESPLPAEKALRRLNEFRG